MGWQTIKGQRYFYATTYNGSKPPQPLHKNMNLPEFRFKFRTKLTNFDASALEESINALKLANAEVSTTVVLRLKHRTSNSHSELRPCSKNMKSPEFGIKFRTKPKTYLPRLSREKVSWAIGRTRGSGKDS